MDEQEKQFDVPMEEGEALLNAFRDALQDGDADAVEAAAARFFAHACEQNGKEFSPNVSLMQEAHEYEDTGAWDKAEMAYRQALSLAESQNSYVMVYKGREDLSALYRFLGRNEQALEEAKAALEAANRSEMQPLVGMALENMAHCWLYQGKGSQALQIAEEMVRSIPAEKLYETQKARALVLRAQCHVELHQPTETQDDLDAAWPLLAPLANVARFAGVQSGLANWWEVAAKLKFLHADFEGAVVAWRKAVEYRRTVSEAPQLEGPYKFAALARSLRSLGQALLAVEDVEGSEQALRESQEIRRNIQQP